tara:strand:- start:158 stop:673 length:516 start_codon:yes stop_codon:yes gene_type:complete
MNMKYKNTKKIFSSKASKIKLIATDIDGVWTDSKMYYTDKGEYMKSFSTYDGMAVSILKEYGIEVAILTSEKSDIVLERSKKLNIEYVYINEHEKLKRILYLSKRLNIDMSEIAYIGDDINDLEVLQNVGLCAMPCTSPILNQIQPDYTTIKPGGEGAFREFVDEIIKYKI